MHDLLDDRALNRATLERHCCCGGPRSRPSTRSPTSSGCRRRCRGIPYVGLWSRLTHDGMATATWRTDLDEDDRRATVVVEHVRPLAKRAVASISAEARRLLRVTQPEAEHDVRFLHRS